MSNHEKEQEISNGQQSYTVADIARLCGLKYHTVYNWYRDALIIGANKEDEASKFVAYNPPVFSRETVEELLTNGSPRPRARARMQQKHQELAR